MNITNQGTGLPAELFTSAKSPAGVRDTLGQTEFLELMTTQLRNQDPLSPMESGDFLGQIAQFATVSGIQDLQAIISDISSSLGTDRSIRAAALLGRNVLVADDIGFLPMEGEVKGAVELQQSTDRVTVEILDRSGARVGLIDLGARGAGLHDFSWSGVGPDGNRLPSDHYRLRAITLQDGKTKGIQTFVNARVAGVEMNPSGRGIRLELDGGGSTGLDAVRRID